MNRRKILILSGIIGLVVALLLLLILVIYFIRRPANNQNSAENPPISYEEPPTSNPISNPVNSDSLKTYTNENLPGLAIKYRSSWQLGVKEFADANSIGFQSKYFPICDSNCMGLSFSKYAVNLNIIFDLALDDSGKKCSNIATYQHIGRSWLRVKDSTGYFYTRNYQLNVTTKPEEPFNLGTANDEWSLLNNTNYKICVNGTGYFRDESVNVNNSPTEPGTLVENPIIQGNPSQDLLNEIDEIVKTLN